MYRVFNLRLKRYEDDLVVTQRGEILKKSTFDYYREVKDKSDYLIEKGFQDVETLPNGGVLYHSFFENDIVKVTFSYENFVIAKISIKGGCFLSGDYFLRPDISRVIGNFHFRPDLVG